MQEKIAKGILDLIVEKNSGESLESIPHSDALLKNVISFYSISKEEFDRYLDILKEAHNIFIINIVKRDENRDIDGVLGYVEADLFTVKKLKNYFQKALVDRFEEEYRLRLGVHQVIRELFPRMNSLNNTPLGHLANKAIMLGEYENLLEKEFNEYTEKWKEKKYSELMVSNSDFFREKENERQERQEKNVKKGNDKNKELLRAVDSEAYHEFSALSSQKTIRKLLKVYGVEFFFRVNLRKYNFEIIRQAVESREINRREDLKLLKTMLVKVKDNINVDPELSARYDEIYKLERIISRYMFIRQ